MSRIGRAPITLPAGVELNVTEDNFVTVKGPKGTFNGLRLPSIAVMDSENGEFRVLRKFTYEDFKSRLS